MSRSPTSRKPGGPTIPIVALAVALAAVSLSVLLFAEQEESEPPSLSRAVETSDVYDPVKAGEPVPDGFRQLLDRDQIAPVYDPAFTLSDAVDWPDDMLVIGVAGPEVQKAYPVTHLNQREMVIDEIEEIPILVSW